jgi:uncharacterized protein (DUF58 family)
MVLTGRGIGCTAGGAVLLGLAWALRYPELAAVGAGALLALALSFTAVAVPPHLSLRRHGSADRVMRGEPVEVVLEVTNLRRWGRLTVIGEDVCAGPGDRRRIVPIPLLRVRPGAVEPVRYAVPTDRRGVVRLGPLRVGRQDAFGLVRVRRNVGPHAEVRVYPRVHALAMTTTGWSRDPDGLAEQAPHGSLTFDTLREYIPGDDLRQVHWRTTARIGQLVVRERVDSSRPRLVVLLDDRAAVHVGDTFEHACEAAASLLTAASRAGVAAHLLTASGSRHAVPAGFLDLLAEAELHEVGSLSAGRHLGDVLVCLTGRPTLDDVASMMDLRHAYRWVGVAAFDPDAELSRVDGVHVLAVRDGAAFAERWPSWWATP